MRVEETREMKVAVDDPTCRIPDLASTALVPKPNAAQSDRTIPSINLSLRFDIHVV